MSNISAGRLGVGGVVSLSDKLSIGIEANYTPRLTAFYVDVAHADTGQVNNRRLKAEDMAGVSLGLRYAY
jgi:hypothetical protein